MTWWRSNRVALGALVVLVPLTIAVMSLSAWGDYTREQPTAAITNGSEPVSYAGSKFELTRVTNVDGAAHGVSGGARVVNVEVAVTPEPGSETTCSSPQLWERGGQRRWNDQSILLDVAQQVGGTVCQSGSAPYALNLFYVVPADATELSLAVISFDELPEFAEIPIISS